MTQRARRATASRGTRRAETVPRTRLRDPVAAAIALDVVVGTIPIGNSLPSADDLVDRFGVSKTVMREALQQLETSGLIRIRQGTTAMVLPEDHWDLRKPLVFSAFQQGGHAASLVTELYEVRMLIESNLAGRAATNATEAERADLKESLNQLKQAAATDARSFLVADQQFHEQLSAIGQSNRILRAIIKDLHDLWQMAWTVDIQDGQIDELLRQHIVIGEAVIAGNPQGAEDAMRDHIQFAMDTDLAS